MKKNIGIVFILSLTFYPFALTASQNLTAQDLADINEVSLTFSEIAHYFEFNAPILRFIGQL